MTVKAEDQRGRMAFALRWAMHESLALHAIDDELTTLQGIGAMSREADGGEGRANNRGEKAAVHDEESTETPQPVRGRAKDQAKGTSW